MRKKITMAVCGLMDSGKSTFIKTFLKTMTGRNVEPDALCLEQETGKTITNTRVCCPVSGDTDLVLIDCPGHFEYLPEILSGLCAADCFMLILDSNRMEKSRAYMDQLVTYAHTLGCPRLMTLISHSKETKPCHYDIHESLAKICQVIKRSVLMIREKERSSLMGPYYTGKVVWFEPGGVKRRNKGKRLVFEDNADLAISLRHSERPPDEINFISGEGQLKKGSRFLICTGKTSRIEGIGVVSRVSPEVV